MAPTIRTKKQRLRLWFEFYKLCLDDPELQDNLKKSEEYYRPWGDISEILFDDWWKDHHWLFGGFRVKEIAKVQSYPNVLNVAIPLDLPISNSIKRVKALIEEKQKERLHEMGIDTETMKTYTPSYGEYSFTRGVEIRGGILNSILLIYKVWVGLDRPAINTEFIDSVKSWFANRPRAKWNPTILMYESELDSSGRGNYRYNADVIRQYRRYIQKGNQVCKDVSLGRFPGRSNLK